MARWKLPSELEGIVKKRDVEVFETGVIMHNATDHDKDDLKYPEKEYAIIGEEKRYNWYLHIGKILDERPRVLLEFPEKYLKEKGLETGDEVLMVKYVLNERTVIDVFKTRKSRIGLSLIKKYGTPP